MKTSLRLVFRSALALVLPFSGTDRARGADRPNLVQNAGFERAAADPARPDQFDLRGDAVRRFAGTAHEFSSMGVALDSGNDRDGDGQRAGAVSQEVPVPTEKLLPGRWLRFTIRGLPEEGFSVDGDDLYLKVDFFAAHGQRALDGVTRKIYPLVQQQRRDLDVNGVGRKGGAATWKTYGFEFRLPFPEIDQVRLSIGFRNGTGRVDHAAFLVDEVCLEPIAAPADVPQAATIRPAAPGAVDAATLVPLGGRWFYRPDAGAAVAPNGADLTVNAENAARLLFQDGPGRYLNPFAENMSAWLRKGYLDLSGQLVDADQFRPDNVTIRFDRTAMIVHARNLPNHPTARFPSPPGSGDRNPSYIQEHDYTYYIPLRPERNPDTRAMDLNNSNRALPMGPIGIAVNGVVFYNPFDAGMTDATDLMDRCCGHPSPDNRYHYHKYPVCVKSPFVDEGKEHSPLIGWAFDGFAIYGPYEAEGVMAKDAKDHPLNDFNVHQDASRGWHYHVTPGKFPYIIGGYWGKVDPRNGDRGRRGGPEAGRGPGPGPGPGGPGGFGGPGGPGGFFPPPSPLMAALDVDRDGVLSAEEIDGASRALRTLDRNGDGVLSLDELRPPRPPGGFGPGGPPPGRGGPPP
jgi:hypothetical protein